MLGSGSKLTDSATLSAGSSLTGTIAFYLYAPNGTTIVDTETVQVKGNGTYPPPPGTCPLRPARISGSSATAVTRTTTQSPPLRGTNRKSWIPASPTLSTTPGARSSWAAEISSAIRRHWQAATIQRAPSLLSRLRPGWFGGGHRNGLGQRQQHLQHVNRVHSDGGRYLRVGRRLQRRREQQLGPHPGPQRDGGRIGRSAPQPDADDHAGRDGRARQWKYAYRLATLSDGPKPTGTLIFTLYGPNGTTVVDTQTVPVKGNKTYNLPAGYTPTSPPARISGSPPTKATPTTNVSLHR